MRGSGNAGQNRRNVAGANEKDSKVEMNLELLNMITW